MNDDTRRELDDLLSEADRFLEEALERDGAELDDLQTEAAKQHALWQAALSDEVQPLNIDLRRVEINQNHILACPVCGDGGKLHQYAVTVGWRYEDGDLDAIFSSINERTPTTKHVTAETAAKYGDLLTYGYRRSYITIRFWCEGCHHVGIELCIAQHKGQTVFTWENLGEQKEDSYFYDLPH